MKRLAVALLLLASLPPLPAQKTRYEQQPKAKPGVNYPLSVHVSGIHLRDYSCKGCYTQLIVDAVIEQKKLELTGYFLSEVQVIPGDYSARLVKTVRNSRSAPLYYEYELILPDRTIWRGTVTGISE